MKASSRNPENPNVIVDINLTIIFSLISQETAQVLDNGE